MICKDKSKPYIPYIPPIPERIYGQENYKQCLTNRKKGEWQFLFRGIRNIPSPYSKDQDYDFSVISEDEWQDVLAPSSLIMQGFDIENNTEYYYKRKLELPKVKKADKIIIRFEGIYSNARVWVNNKYIKSHIGGFTQWDCDLSAFSGEEITVVIGVTDVEGDKKGIWNPGGETISNAAWASYYAHNNIGGIIRDITLFVLPENYIARTHTNTMIFDRSAVLETYIEAYCASGNTVAELILKDDGNNIVSRATCRLEKLEAVYANSDYKIRPDKKWRKKHRNAFMNDEKYKDLFVSAKNDFAADHFAKVSMTVNNPKLWDAEHPNLYSLSIKLITDGKIQQENTQKTGIREITSGGEKGTPANRIFVNGREIKLRGVCRHDVSHLYGRSLTKEDIYNEILTYKKNNINFIRTSHYPAADYMLEVCDELGMFVEQENAACFKGANHFEIYNAPQEFLQSFAEMIESARNHASVIIWSLANESDFEKTYAFRAEFNYVKKVDKTRPVIFSYPHLVHSKPLPYDIISKHYAKVTGNLGSKKAPSLHDEFAHVSCYNISRLQKDNSVRDFWGESIKIGWDSIFNTDGALGCAVWAAVDDVFCIPQGTHERHQSHSGGPYAGYGEWGCIFDLFKREKPEAYLTKKAFTPILIDEEKTVIGQEVELHITNRFDHTFLTEVKMVVSDGEKNIYNDYLPLPVAPHGSGKIAFKNSGADRYLVEFYFSGLLVDSYLIPCQKEYTDIPKGTDKMDECIDLSNDTLVCKRAKYRIIKTKKADRIDIKIVPKNIFALLASPDKSIFKFNLKSDIRSVSWKRNTRYSVYPPEHISRAEGTAYILGADNKYGVKPDTGWEKDNENYFLYPQSDGRRKISNDFLTRRNHIKNYTVTFENGKTLNVLSDEGSINACICRSEKDQNCFELQITKGCYYPDLEWGNYFGKKSLKIKDKVISFSLTCNGT